MAGALLKYNGQALQTPSGAYGINNLVPENIADGVNVGGIVGSFTGKNIEITSVSVYVGGSTISKTFTSIPKQPFFITFYAQTGDYGFQARGGYSAEIGSNVLVINGTDGRIYSGTYTYNEATQSLTITSTDNALFKTSYYRLVCLCYE